MARFEQDINDFDNFLNTKRKQNSAPISESEYKPKFKLEDKTELAEKFNEKRKYINAKNKAFLEHLTKGSSYNPKNRQKILDYVSKMAIENNNLHKELEDEKNCSCSRIKEGLPALQPKPKKLPKISNRRRFRLKKRPKRKGVFKTLLGADGSVDEEVTIIDNRKPIIDFKEKSTWIGLTVIIGAIYFLRKNK